MVAILYTLVASVPFVFSMSSALICGSTPVIPNMTVPIEGCVSCYFPPKDSIAKPYTWPWQIYTNVCDGTILTEKWIMSAGHCPFEIGDIVKAGVFRRSQYHEPGEQERQIEEIHRHPDFNYYTSLNDITLVKLKQPLTFTDHIQPVCIPKNDTEMIKPGVGAVITGWGWGEPRHDHGCLHQAVVHMQSEEECAVYGDIYNPIDKICSSDPGKDTCQGYSGGPHVNKCEKTGRWFQTGITSFGHGCAEPYYPGVYARVSHFCNFIHETTGEEICK